MGEAVEKLSGKLGVDTTDFKTNIAAANRELRLLESGFKSNVASLGDWSKSATGMESRISSLTSKIEVQSLKVAALRENFERIKVEQGENSRAAKEAEIALNKETETLGKMEAELTSSEQALQDLSSAENEAGESAEEAGGKVEGFGNVLSGMGTFIKGSVTLLLGLVTVLLAVTAGISSLVFSTADASAQLVDLSAKTGISTERLQELNYISDQVGTSQETITGSLARLVRSMSSAQTQYSEYATAQADAAAKGEEFDGQLGDNAAAFDRLGVSVIDSSGNLRDSEAVFADLITALGKVPNEAERDALSMGIFGKSAQELNPLIKAGSGELARLAEEAHKVGAVMSEEDVAAFEAFDDTLASLQAGLKGTLGTLAAAFLPGFQAVFDQAGGYLEQFKGIVDGSGGDIGKMATGVGGLISTIISDVAAQVPQLMQTGMTILMSIVDAILQNLPMMISTGVELLLKLVDGLVTALPALVEAALKAIIELANGLTQALPTLIPTIVGVVLKIVEILLENLPMLIDAALQLILALAQGLVAALPVLIPAIPIIMQAVFDALISAYPMITSAAAELIVTLAQGIIKSIPTLLIAVVELIAIAINYLLNDAPQMFRSAGENLIAGLWEGIKNNMSWLKQNFVSEMMSVVTAVKNAMGIHSPSDLLADEVGEMMPPGVGKGFDKAMPALHRHLTRSMLGLASDVSQAAAPQMGVSGTGGVGSALSSFSFGDIIVNVPGTTATPQQIGTAVQNGLLSALRSKGAA